MKESFEILTTGGIETKKLGEKLSREIMKPSYAKASEDKLKTATVLSLEGELGAGKTTFTQGFAKGLGIKDKIQSPTFVILKIYKIPKKGHFKSLIHVDAYRLTSKDFKAFNWRGFVSNSENLILVEWGNKIKNILPKDSLIISFGHIGQENKRLITKK